MLDTDTKRRIDTARDILVGKVPDPKSQVEQITIALIYKFMDDMDAESEEFGGVRKFFAGEFARYGWAKLMHAGLGGFETLNLYAEAIAKMPENPGIPLLFRNIFKNAYLPYRDPETLKMFLKVIDEFNYDHSERLGDAFEYLLSVLGSQGDAGQFRTPRHIIDFMVEVVDPNKNETCLDPACGTAGFLISSYKHILKANTDAKGNSTLTPDEKGRLAQNFRGYDISPDMVRLSLVNMYLHGFTDPHIYEYDTLTSQDRWNDYADVILANPPFMSPKGGIKPHNRFSVQSKRSEVLFVDYMAEHLTPGGRAGIIVPEGIIFQSQTAYRDLRKMLVDTALVAVVSLPAGVFQPYSGVKTSILILDKSLAKKADAIAFFKVENDGFGLGAQRREIDKNDLPETARLLREWLDHGIHGTHGKTEKDRSVSPSVFSVCSAVGNCLIVPKEKIAANGDYNLSGERYREGSEKQSIFPRVPLKEICAFISDGDWIESKDQSPAGIRLIQTGNVGIGEYLDKGDKARYISEETFKRLQCTEVFEGDVLVSRLPDPVGRACMLPGMRGRAITAVDCSILRFDPQRFISTLFPYYTQSAAYYRQLDAFLTGASRSRISRKNLETIKIPLPPLEVQKEIVAEIEGYQKVIDGARAVLDNYRPRIPIHPDWPMVAVGDVVEFVSGLTVSIPEVECEGGTPIIAINNVTEDGTLTLDGLRWIKPPTRTLNYAQKGDLLFNWRNGSKRLVGKTALFNLDGQYLFASFLLGIRAHPDRVDSSYLWHTLNIYRREGRYMQFMRMNVNGLFNREELKMVEIPLPPLATQQAIVAEIEAEQALVAANRELIARFEKKIQATLARVWGEDAPADV
jgi:type I restriction enzyme M protein